MAPRAKKKVKSSLTAEERRLLRKLIEGHNALVDRMDALEDKVGIHREIGFHTRECGEKPSHDREYEGSVPGDGIQQPDFTDEPIERRSRPVRS